MPRTHGRKIPSVQGHQFSVTTQPVDSGKASTFSLIYVGLNVTMKNLPDTLVTALS